MAIQISAVSQKGGVGKSSIIRLVAREFAANNWQVKIADFDIKQGTCINWKMRREQYSRSPDIAVESFRTVSQVQRIVDMYDLVLYDGQPHSTVATLEIARVCNKILLPTGLSRDDLIPSILLAHELKKEQIDMSSVAFVLCKVGDSELEIKEAREYIRQAGYLVLDGAIPEKIGYRRALDEGRSFTEATHPSLRQKAEILAQNIIDFITNHDQNSITSKNQ